MTRPNQGLSSLAPGGGKMRDPGNEVAKSEIHMKHFVSPASNLAPKIVVPLALPGGIIAVLFSTKYVVRRQIKSGIL